MGPCHVCPEAGALGFNLKLAAFRKARGTIWSCGSHAAALPTKAEGAAGMSAWTRQMEEALGVATEALAQHWIDKGLGEAVRIIGPENAREGAKVLFDAFWAARERQLNNNGVVNDIPW